MAERRIESGHERPDAVARDAAGTGGAEPAAYRVGKGRPPTGRRFARGQSGNPRGRPKMRGGSGKPGDRLIGADQPTRRMILEEAYRTITVRDGDEEIQMTANRAVFRAMMERALKGSRIAQRKWIEMVEQAEAEQRSRSEGMYGHLPGAGRFRPGADAAHLRWQIGGVLPKSHAIQPKWLFPIIE